MNVSISARVQYNEVKQMGIFFSQNVISFSNNVLYTYDISVWNWSNTMNI